MTLQYSDILSSVKRCDGGIINIIKDRNRNNKDFLYVLKNDLRKDYNIIENVSYENLNKHIEIISEKTIFFVELTNIILHNAKLNRFNINYNNNVIVVFITESYRQFNNNYGADVRMLYSSTLALNLNDNKIKIIKDRYSNINDNDPMDINNFISKIRKSKLLKISKINL